MKQFFGRPLFDSEQIQHNFFLGGEFLPAIDVYKLPKDSTPVRYWFKKPNELSQHQIAHIISGDDLQKLYC
jgi:hypothetical protein